MYDRILSYAAYHVIHYAFHGGGEFVIPNVICVIITVNEH
jgi:hypothetical protein